MEPGDRALPRRQTAADRQQPAATLIFVNAVLGTGLDEPDTQARVHGVEEYREFGAILSRIVGTENGEARLAGRHISTV